MLFEADAGVALRGGKAMLRLGFERAEGFGDAKTLSRKMCKLYILCSEQLSQQPRGRAARHHRHWTALQRSSQLPG